MVTPSRDGSRGHIEREATTGNLHLMVHDDLAEVREHRLSAFRRRVHDMDGHTHGLATSVFGNKLVEDLLLNDGLLIRWEQR